MRERVLGGIGSGAEFVALRVGIAAQTIAERLREPLQSTIGCIRGNYEHLDLRGRRRLGYAKITAAVIGVGVCGFLLSDTLLPGNTLSWIKIWGVVPGASMATWALLELREAIADRIQSRHTPIT